MHVWLDSHTHTNYNYGYFNHKTFLHCISWKYLTLFITDMFYNHNKNTSHLFPFNSNAHVYVTVASALHSGASIPRPPPPALFIVRCHKAVNLSTVVPHVYTKSAFYFPLTLGQCHVFSTCVFRFYWIGAMVKV